jgi:hypothetical protein
MATKAKRKPNERKPNKPKPKSTTLDALKTKKGRGCAGPMDQNHD